MPHLLTDIFTKLLGMSLEASLAAAAVLVMRLLFHRAPKWTHCLMWALVAVKLLCPYAPQSSLSVMPSDNPLERGIRQSAAISSAESQTAAPTAPNETVTSHAIAPSGDNAPLQAPSDARIRNETWLTAAAYVWLCGLLGIALHAAISCFQLRRRLSEAVLLRDNIYLTDRMNSAFLFGFLHPKIYLPFGISDAYTPQIIAHEKAHLHRLDHLTKPLAFAIAAVYWFHPVVWLSYLLYCRDIELACDERAVRGKTIEQRKAYSRALLECSLNASAFSFHNQIPIGFGKTAVKRRVTNVLKSQTPKNQKNALWLIGGALGATAVAAAVLLTRPQASPTDIPDELDKAVTLAIFEQNDVRYTQVSPTDMTDDSIDGLIAQYNRYDYFGSGYFGYRTDVECVGEGHIILGTKQSGSTVEVYALCSACGYGFRDGYFVDNSGYFQVPTRFTFTIDEHGTYIFDNVKEAEDGDLFPDSVYEMFPKSVADEVFSASHQDRYYEELTEQCNRCAATYLETIGRQAQIGSYADFDFKILSDYGVSAEVSNALLELHPEYDIYVGNFETIEFGTRYIYQQIWSPDPNVYGNGTVTFLKCEYDTGKEMEKFAYRVEGDHFTQIK